MRAVIYLRQSLDKNNDELGIKRQLGECERLSDARGYKVVETVEDNNRSATYGERPGYQRVLHLINNQLVDVVVVLRIDRLLRRPIDLEWLINLCETTGVSVATVDGVVDLTTASGRQIARLQAAFARWEVEVKSERHILANEQRARAGKPHGSRRPFGYRSDLVTVEESEAAVLRDMAKWVMRGESYKTVAYRLNERGIKTTLNRDWYPITIRNMLLKPRYAGIREYKGIRYEGQWQPVFEREYWEQLQAVMETKRLRNPDRPTARKYLLTGLVFCGKCGTPLNGSTKRDKPERPLRRTYYCRVHGDTQRARGCGGVTRNADALEHFIRECVIFRLDSTNLAALLGMGKAEDAEIKTLLEKRSRQAQLLDSFIASLADGTLDARQFKMATSIAKSKLNEIDREIAAISRKMRKIELPVDSTIREAWSANNDDWRRALMEQLIDRIELQPGITKPYYNVDGKVMRFDPSLVDIRWLA